MWFANNSHGASASEIDKCVVVMCSGYIICGVTVRVQLPDTPTLLLNDITVIENVKTYFVQISGNKMDNTKRCIKKCVLV